MTPELYPRHYRRLHKRVETLADLESAVAHIATALRTHPKPVARPVAECHQCGETVTTETADNGQRVYHNHDHYGRLTRHPSCVGSARAVTDSWGKAIYDRAPR